MVDITDKIEIRVRKKNRNQGQNPNNQTSQSSYQNSLMENKGLLFLFPAYVGNKRTFCLRDTGATNIMVDRKIAGVSPNYRSKIMDK